MAKAAYCACAPSTITASMAKTPPLWPPVTPFFDAAASRQIRRGVEFNLSVDNLTDRNYYETQNYFVSRVSPTAPAVARIHGTPGYPRSLVVGLTFRLRGKG